MTRYKYISSVFLVVYETGSSSLLSILEPCDKWCRYTVLMLRCFLCVRLKKAILIAGNNQYDNLRKIFLATGRGRRPDLPELQQLTNTVLLQINTLREEGNKTYKEAAQFLHRAFPDVPLCRLQYLVYFVQRNLENSEDKENFLMESHPASGVGPVLEELGLTRTRLLKGDYTLVSLPSPSNGLLFDLHCLKKQESASFKDMCTWWRSLTQKETTPHQLKKMCEKLETKRKKLISNGRTSELASFMVASVSDVQPQPSVPQCASTVSVTNHSQSREMELSTRVAEQGRQLAAARRQADENKETVKKLEEENTLLKEQLRKSQEQHCCLEEKLTLAEATAHEASMKYEHMHTELLSSQERLKDLQKKVKYYAAQGHLRKYRRLQTKTTELQAENDILSTKEQSLKNKLRRTQESQAELKRKLGATRRRLQRHVHRVDPPPQGAAPLAQDEIPVLRLKDERGYFKPEATVCAMSLIGECEVPPKSCGVVIQTVAKQLLNCAIPDGDLPSMRTALRFADRGHVLSKMHVAEAVLEGDRWDLHTDGTSRCGKKYVGQQVNVDGTTFSTGYTAVSTENTQCLVDITFNLLQELSELYDPDAAQEKFVTMLSQLAGIMTDRASVMKSFARQLDIEVKDMLQRDETLEFLHCNAHFLLGMSSECEKALKTQEKAAGEALGRDRVPSFRSFQASDTSSSASRYIRTACDCLGPRGDDRNGCRDSWETYCLMSGRTSQITSFRGNRFNNLFQAAAGLHYHREDVEQCLGQFLSKQNRKLQSVLADNRDDQIDCCLVALGLLYYRVTGPYWLLLSKDIPYLELFRFIEMLLQFFRRWADNPADAFTQDYIPLFNFHFMPNPDVFQSLLAVSVERQEKVLEILKLTCKGFVEVTKRQLNDFLPEGRYFDVQDPALKEKMKHSKLTNLVSEKAFGDLDFSLFKRSECHRYASLHHHSTIHMLKWNRTISVWLLMKDAEEQRRLLRVSAEKAPDVRRAHVREEKDAVARRQLILEENRQKKVDAENRKREKTEQVLENVRKHGGPSRTADDVDRLLSTCVTKAEQLAAVKAQLSYHKDVLSVASPLLRLTGKLQTLASNLKLFLGAEPNQAAMPVPYPTNRRQPRIIPVEEPDDNGGDSNSDTEMEEQDAHEIGNTDFVPYKFLVPGEMIAVHFDNDFYIGEVCDVHGELEGSVNFMERCVMPPSTSFRWPKSQDRCKVHRNFVFSTVDLVPASSSGRLWRISNLDEVEERYATYKSLFC